MDGVSFAIAILSLPEAVKNVIEISEEITRRIEVYQNAPQVLQKLYTYGYAYHSGVLRSQLSIADQAAARAVDHSLVQAMYMTIRLIRDSLAETKDEIYNLIEANGTFHKLRFTLSGESRLRRWLADLERLQQGFVNLIIVAEAGNRDRKRSESAFLPREKLRYIYESWEQGMIQSTRPHVRICDAEWKQADRDEVQEIRVLVEQVSASPATCQGELEANTNTIACCLGVQSISPAFLPCMGYRNSPTLDLIFRVPTNLHNPRSLQDMIWHTAAGSAEVQRRLELAESLAQAVLSVHAADFVHKNIRPETILIFQQQKSIPTVIDTQQYSDEIAILTEWQFSRKQNDTSSRRGSGDWQENIYRHPARQGIKPQERYNMGHDVYSLGVCLLEIGLWTSLLTMPLPSAGASQVQVSDLSTIYRDAAAAITSSDSSDDVDISLFQDLTRPFFVAQVIKHLAAEKLPLAMGREYAQLVLGCLTCLEVPAQKAVYRGDKVKAELNFHETILQPLIDMRGFAFS